MSANSTAPKDAAPQAIQETAPQASSPMPSQSASGVEVPSAPESQNGPAVALSVWDAVAIALVLGFVALMGWALARKRRERARDIGAEPDLPRLDAGEAGKAAGQIDADGDRALESAERTAEAATSQETTEAQPAVPLSKAELEAQRKEAYRAKKARDLEAKEARRRAAEARQREEEEAAKAAQMAIEEAAAQKAEAERQKIAAEAGKTLSEGLARTRGGLVAGLNAFWRKDKAIDEALLCELEEVLFGADIGVKTSMRLIEFARDKLKRQELGDADKLKSALMDEMRRIVSVRAAPIDFESKKPFVLMVAGVNGAGKTTTIGKLAAKLTGEGKKVVLAAGDTFRAAAAEQLEVWGERSGATVVRGKEGGDPGAVIFDAIKRGVAEGADVIIADTAGRLHTKAPLMEELCRVQRVMDKALSGAPHHILLVLDATNGQNAIAQAREFNAALKLDGIVLTKLDGTAKGGVVIGICDELKLPIRYIGIGEAVADLRPFDGEAFVNALFE